MTSASVKKHDTFDFFEAIFCWRKCFWNWQLYQQIFTFCLRFTPFKKPSSSPVPALLCCCPWLILRNAPLLHSSQFVSQVHISDCWGSNSSGARLKIGFLKCYSGELIEIFFEWIQRNKIYINLHFYICV